MKLLFALTICAYSAISFAQQPVHCETDRNGVTKCSNGMVGQYNGNGTTVWNNGVVGQQAPNSNQTNFSNGASATVNGNQINYSNGKSCTNYNGSIGCR